MPEREKCTPPQVPNKTVPLTHPRRAVDQGVVRVVYICSAVKTLKRHRLPYSTKERREATMSGHQLSGVKGRTYRVQPFNLLI
ncbi:hypothetical protein M0804_014997 [Polistes exclamans]|nr:hypothetical protein M0804_014997 [Polistes exclamans]